MRHCIWVSQKYDYWVISGTQVNSGKRCGPFAKTITGDLQFFQGQQAWFKGCDISVLKENVEIIIITTVNLSDSC